MPKAIPAMPKAWQQFFVSVLFIVFFPLAALAIDLFTKSYIPDEDLFLTFGLFTIGAGAASKSEGILAIAIFGSCGYLMAYGCAIRSVSCSLDRPQMNWVEAGFSYGIALIFLCVVVGERYNRHVFREEPFWDFS